MAQLALADLLLRRKELAGQVAVLSTIKANMLQETRAERVKSHEGIDDVVAKVPIMRPEEVMHAFNWHSSMLRQVDSLIQRTNWETKVDVGDKDLMAQYVSPEKPKGRGKDEEGRANT